MKIQCEIIRDILPLYAEDMVSQPTRAMVEAHLEECEGCTRELEHLKKPEEPLQINQLNSLNRVSSIIHNSRILSVVATVLMLLSFGVWLWAFLHVPVFLDVEDAVSSVYQKENGALVIDYHDYVRGSVGIAQPGYTQGHICFTTRWDMLSLHFGWTERVFDRKLVSGCMWYESEDGRGVIIQADEDTPPEDILDWGTDKSWWYLNYRTAEAETALWDAEEPVPSGKLAYVDCDLTVPVIISTVLAVMVFIFHRQLCTGRFKSILWNVGALCVVFSVSTMAVTAGQTVLYCDYIEPLSYILLLTILLWITALVLKKYRKLNQTV